MLKDILTHLHQPSNQSILVIVKSTSKLNEKMLVGLEVLQNSHSKTKQKFSQTKIWHHLMKTIVNLKRFDSDPPCHKSAEKSHPIPWHYTLNFDILT